MGIEPFVVSSLRARRAQPAPRADASATSAACRTSRPRGARLLHGVRRQRRPRNFLSGAGCTFCANTGYQDRIGVYELLRLTPEMKAPRRGSPSYDDVRDLAVSQGTRTLRHEAVRLVSEGTTTIAEIVRSIYLL
jgi:type IV pilus assembly protein PilB